MRKSEIVVGGQYLARISGKIVTVCVDAIVDNTDRMPYYRSNHASYRVTNLATGRKVTFRSAAKFRGVAEPVKGVSQ